MESGIQHIFHSLSVLYTIVAMQNVFCSPELSQECAGTHSDYILPRPDVLSFGSSGIRFFRIRNIWFLLIRTSLRPRFIQPFTCQRYSSPLKLKIWRNACHEKNAGPFTATLLFVSILHHVVLFSILCRFPSFVA